MTEVYVWMVGLIAASVSISRTISSACSGLGLGLGLGFRLGSVRLLRLRLPVVRSRREGLAYRPLVITHGCQYALEARDEGRHLVRGRDRGRGRVGLGLGLGLG